MGFGSLIAKMMLNTMVLFVEISKTFAQHDAFLFGMVSFDRAHLLYSLHAAQLSSFLLSKGFTCDMSEYTLGKFNDNNC